MVLVYGISSVSTILDLHRSFLFQMLLVRCYLDFMLKRMKLQKWKQLVAKNQKRCVVQSVEDLLISARVVSIVPHVAANAVEEE